jgi:hypothetical protein
MVYHFASISTAIILDLLNLSRISSTTLQQFKMDVQACIYRGELSTSTIHTNLSTGNVKISGWLFRGRAIVNPFTFTT